jgi:hypothetical protein
VLLAEAFAERSVRPPQAVVAVELGLEENPGERHSTE